MKLRNDSNNNKRMGGLPPDQIPGGLPPDQIPGGLPPDERDVRPVETIDDIVRIRLEEVKNAPLVKIKSDVKPESTDLEEIIKPVKEIIKTGEVIDDNLLIKPKDKTTIDEVSQILSKPKDLPQPPPRPIPADILSDRDRARLFAEEDKRRMIEDERFNQFQQALEEDIERRKLFDEEIRLMKSEFDIYLKKTFPEFVGDKAITDNEVEAKIRKNEEERRMNEQKQKDIQKKKIERLEAEKQRKLKEAQLQLNKITEREVQTFFEEEILIEQREKLSKNKELEGLNDVQRAIRDMKHMEIRMGRPIVPHRDIVESDDSDFDREGYTDSKDILIKPDLKFDPIEEERKMRMLEELKYRLNPSDTNEKDYILKDVKQKN